MDDENLPRGARELAAGVAIYVISPKDAMADRNDVAGFAEEAVLLRLVFQRALGKTEDEQAFRDRFPELFDDLSNNLELCKSVMGELMAWLEAKIPALATKTTTYKGKKLAVYLDDEESREQLFDDGLVFRTEYPVDESTIGDKLKKAATILDALKRSRADEARAKGIAAG